MFQMLLIVAAVIALKIYTARQNKLKNSSGAEGSKSSVNAGPDLGVYWDSKDELYFLVDGKDKKISEDFCNVSDFSEGLAAVERAEGKGPSYGYIDVSGKFVIPPQFDDAYGFNNGVAKVMLNDKTFFIDKTGQKVNR